jgi:hypothetical protein
MKKIKKIHHNSTKTKNLINVIKLSKTEALALTYFFLKVGILGFLNELESILS